MIKVFTIEPEYEALANCYLAVDEQSNEAALVDPGCYIKNAPEAVKSSGANVKDIFLTHGHFDHIGGKYCCCCCKKLIFFFWTKRKTFCAEKKSEKTNNATGHSFKMIFIFL